MELGTYFLVYATTGFIIGCLATLLVVLLIYCIFDL